MARPTPQPPSSRGRYAIYLASQTQGQWSKLDSAEASGQRERKAKRARSFRFLLSSIIVELRAVSWRRKGLAGLWRGNGVRTLAMALGTLTLSTILALILPSATKIAIDFVILDQPGPSGLPMWVPRTESRVTLLWLLGGAMLVAALASVIVGVSGRYQTTRLTKLLQARLRRRAFAHAVHLPLHRIQALKSGGLVSILREDAGAAGDLLFSLFYNPWRAIVQFTGTLIVLASVDWRMLVGGLALVPATWYTHRQWIAKIRPIFRDMKITRSLADAHSTETFAGIRVVRGFSRGRSEGKRFMLSNHYMGRQEMLAWCRSRVLEIVWAFLVPGASVAVLLYGGARVIDGNLTIGDVMMFSTYVLMLLSPIETLTATATTVQNNLAALDRVLDLLDEPRELSEHTTERPLLKLKRANARGLVEFRDVSFSYPSLSGSGIRVPASAPGRLVLEGVCLAAHPGQTIALVGASGAGKTTLSNLVARFYDPTGGQVLFDGTDLRDIEPASYRSLLGIVEQDVFLFDGSIGANIAYGRRHATPAEIKTAAERAHAHEFIAGMEDGYDTIIGERGVRLSGGQRQRLAIARAILADPVVLILDEATSNLDAENEALIRESLGVLMKGRTCFVIAHRLSTIRSADRIIVIDSGRIREEGTHDELIHAGGKYAQLLRRQIDPSTVPA